MTLGGGGAFIFTVYDDTAERAVHTDSAAVATMVRDLSNIVAQAAAIWCLLTRRFDTLIHSSE